MQAAASHLRLNPILPTMGTVLVELRADLADLGPAHSRRDVTLVGEVLPGSIVIRADCAGYEIHVGCSDAARLVRSVSNGGGTKVSPLTNFQRALLAA